MTVFERTLALPVTPVALSDWHFSDGAFARLGPPWETMRPVLAEPMKDGAQRIFEVKKAGMWMRWEADHQDVVPGERFTDVQAKGPFKSWVHTHRFEASDSGSRLVDHVEYELPGGAVGRALAGGSIAKDIDRMFAYRHRITKEDLMLHARYAGRPRLRIAVTGASGLVGAQLVAFLRTGGHTVLRFVRTAENPADDEIRWSTTDGVKDAEKLNGVDAVIHLAGENVGQRWTEAVKARIRDSRVDGTRVLVDALSRCARKPKVLVSASAVGFYGDTGETVVDESAPLGDGFLAEVCAAWEAEAQRTQEFGVRLVTPRIGVVMDPRGGALAKLLPIFQSGLGGKVGSGEQLMSCIALDDVLGALLFCVQEENLTGPVNLCAPEPVHQKTMAKVLGRVLGRPAIAPAPAPAIKMMFGQMGEQTVLSSTGTTARALLEAGYTFRYPTLEDTLRHCLGRPG